MVVKIIQFGEIANGILNPVWARNLKEFNPVYVGYKEICFSRERVKMYFKNMSEFIMGKIWPEIKYEA